MNKKILLVSTLIAMSMVLMFTSCKKELKGCNCKILDEYAGSTTNAFTIEQMQGYYKVNSCDQLVGALKSDDPSSSYTCTELY